MTGRDADHRGQRPGPRHRPHGRLSAAGQRPRLRVRQSGQEAGPLCPGRPTRQGPATKAARGRGCCAVRLIAAVRMATAPRSVPVSRLPAPGCSQARARWSTATRNTGSSGWTWTASCTAGVNGDQRSAVAWRRVQVSTELTACPGPSATPRPRRLGVGRRSWPRSSRVRSVENERTLMGFAPTGIRAAASGTRRCLEDDGAFWPGAPIKHHITPVWEGNNRAVVVRGVRSPARGIGAHGWRSSVHGHRRVPGRPPGPGSDGCGRRRWAGGSR